MSEEEKKDGIDLDVDLEIEDPKDDDKSDKPEGKDKEPADAPKKKEWDKERQKKDQELANYRKKFEKVEADRVADKKAYEERIGKMEDTISELLEKAKSNPNPENTAAQDEALDDLSEEDFDLNRAKVLRVLKKTSNLSARALDQLQKAAKENADLKKELESVKSSETRRSTKERSQEFIEAVLTECDDEYGEKYRNDAYKAAIEYLRKKGYSSDNKPSEDAVRIAIERFYAEAAEKGKTKKAEPAKEQKDSFALDTGLGGRVAAAEDTSCPEGTDAEVKAWMKEHGL